MIDQYGPETAAGQASTSEDGGATRVLASSEAARKAAATRRRNQAIRQREDWEGHFIVVQQTVDGNDFVDRYPAVGERAVTLDAILTRWSSPDLWTDDGDPEGGRLIHDLAVWRGGHLVAVLRKRGDRYEAVRFDG